MSTTKDSTKTRQRPKDVDLLFGDEAKTRYRELVDLGQWWVLPWLSGPAARLSIEIERRHYRGGMNEDFAICFAIVEGVPFVTSFAAKRRMSARQFAAAMIESGLSGTSVEALTDVLKTQDVMIVSDPDIGESKIMERATAWYRWVLNQEPKGDFGIAVVKCAMCGKEIFIQRSIEETELRLDGIRCQSCVGDEPGEAA